MSAAVPIPYGYCHCGCGQRTHVASRSDSSKGWLKGEPIKYVNGHHHQAGEPYVIDAAGCWVWQRLRNASGYGRMSRGLAHRVYYEERVGPIPDEMHLDHLCRNRACVNPDHLEPVTAQENARRSARTKLSLNQAAAIRALRGKMSAQVIAERYGVTTGPIYAIWKGKTWVA